MTESPDLLVQEYKLIKEVLAAADAEAAASLQTRQKSLSQSLLKRRDEAIAERINDTLGPGETGFLFLGMLHSVAGLLAEDIRVTYPISPPNYAGTS